MPRASTANLNNTFYPFMEETIDSGMLQLDWNNSFSPYSSLSTFDSPSPASASSAASSPSTSTLGIPSEKSSRNSKSHQRAPGYVPRPQNSWILFRSARFRELADSPEGKIQQGDLSKMIAAEWRALRPQERQFWDALAVEKAKEHKKQYPNYKFQPRRKVAKRVAIEHERRTPQYVNAVEVEVEPTDFSFGMPADWIFSNDFLLPSALTMPATDLDTYSVPVSDMMQNDSFGFDVSDYLWLQ